MSITQTGMKTLKLQVAREVIINKAALRLCGREERSATNFLKMFGSFRSANLFWNSICWLALLNPKLIFMLNRMGETCNKKQGDESILWGKLCNGHKSIANASFVQGQCSFHWKFWNSKRFQKRLIESHTFES